MTRIHPLVAGAAAGVIVLSGVAVAAFTGVLPMSNAEKATVKEKQFSTAPACSDCGVVVHVKQVEVKGEATGMGAVIGGVAGAVVGRELADRRRDVGTVVGAAGGAIAGHQIERHARTKQRYTVQVRMNDGSIKSVTFDEPPSWQSGDRVRVQNGKLIARKAPAA